jgi:hypothetical protein
MKKLAIMLGMAALSASAFSVTVTLEPLSTFGGGDGWLAPNEFGYAWLGDPGDPTTEPPTPPANLHLARGLAYNPVTRNVIVVSRFPATDPTQWLRIIDGTTGLLEGNLPLDPDFVEGGVFRTNMVGVTDAGVIYVGNLTTTATIPFRVYRWESETAVATLAFSDTFGGVRPRTGDAFDVEGVGVLTQMTAGGGAATPGYVVLNTTDGLAFTGANFAPVDAHAGDFRLGVTFVGPHSVWGGQPLAPMRRSTFFPTLSNDGTSTLTTMTQPILDYAVVGGVPVLVTLDWTDSWVRVYTLEDPAAPTFRAWLNNTLPPRMTNVNGTGQVKIADIVGNTATIYAMTTNQGIQAMRMTVTPPGRTVNGTVEIEGRAPGGGVLNGLTLSVELRQGGTAVDTRTITLDDNGAFSFVTPVPAGVYDIWMKRPHGHLATLGTGIDLSGATTVYNPPAARAGDSNGDNLINLDDFLILAANYEVVPPPDVTSDYNGDGAIDIADFLLLAANYDSAGPP